VIGRCLFDLTNGWHGVPAVGSVLAGWARRRKTSQALVLRAQIVLRSADGGTIGEVAQQCHRTGERSW
jgi:hypothetical protein